MAEVKLPIMIPIRSRETIFRRKNENIRMINPKTNAPIRAEPSMPASDWKKDNPVRVPSATVNAAPELIPRI